MSHYYQYDPNLQHKQRLICCYLLGVKYDFYTDVGVFSNDQVDYGSFTFLKTLLKEKKVEDTLDMGCGYGVIGIILKANHLTERIDLCDINPRAVELTQENIKLYSLKDAKSFVSDGFEYVNKQYDRIVMNPPIRAGKAVIYKMFEESKKHLKKHGELWIVIKKDLGAPSAIKKLKTIFTFVEVIEKDRGYYTIKSYEKLINDTDVSVINKENKG